MTKSDFFNSLRASLTPLSKEECNKFIIYYEEIFEDYKESGLTEKEAIDKLGNPHIIANDILSDQDNINVKVSPFRNNILNVILLILGFPLWGSILLALTLLILSANIIIWCIPFTTGVSSIAFLIAALVSIIGSPFMMADILEVGIVQLGVGIASIGLSILLAFLTLFLSRKLAVITKQLILIICKKFNKKVVRL
ncbi:DUF1700 domain-containing protein [Clostridium hydrogeniformans]|uniref:DUF1700 domain-containing protein n=1 Tax=Clostridium hydrogeniformans TaxID=349933 RepID=UPI0004865B31|nr:DUF1700 domain-containing protein [Clostridium hydrogeniformans]